MVLPGRGTDEVFRGGSLERGLTIPAEGRGGHWILKLPSEQFPLVPENEHSMMQLAGAVGIETAETGLVQVREIERLPHLQRVSPMRSG